MGIAIAQMSTRAGDFGATADRVVELSRPWAGPPRMLARLPTLPWAPGPRQLFSSGGEP